MASASPKANVPGVPAGVPSSSGGAPGASPAPSSGLAGGAAPVPKPPFGGNVGKKPRTDGLKPGSPEAIAAVRAKDAERKRREYAAKSAAVPPPTLPAAASPVVPVPGDAPGAPVPALGGEGVAPVDDWRAEDLNDLCRELVELGEAWRVEAICKECVAAKLPRKVVDEFASAAAFPAGSKRSLSTSLPGTLAKAFNATRVPIALKSVITVIPALTYVILRDIQLHSKLNKLVADEAERAKAEQNSKP